MVQEYVVGLDIAMDDVRHKLMMQKGNASSRPQTDHKTRGPCQGFHCISSVPQPDIMRVLLDELTNAYLKFAIFQPPLLGSMRVLLDVTWCF